MEIRNVENEVKKEYPKMEQISKKRLTKCIPGKWKKLGLSYVLINMMVKSKVWAFDPSNTIIAGNNPIHVPKYISVIQSSEFGNGAMTFFIVGIILRFIIINPKFKIIRILTDILIIISLFTFIAHLIVNKFY